MGDYCLSGSLGGRCSQIARSVCGEGRWLTCACCRYREVLESTWMPTRGASGHLDWVGE